MATKHPLDRFSGARVVVLVSTGRMVAVMAAEHPSGRCTGVDA